MQIIKVLPEDHSWRLFKLQIWKLCLGNILFVTKLLYQVDAGHLKSILEAFHSYLYDSIH